MRQFIDDLPTSPSVSRLRAMGAINPASKTVLVTFGEGEAALKREVRVAHTRFPSGGSWSYFVCPSCARRVRTIRLHEKPMCRRCCLQHGLRYRSGAGSPTEKAEARRVQVERLKAKLEGGPLRFKPRPGRTIDRRRSLELSLTRALIRVHGEAWR
jgi:hypothetical protein